MALGLGTWAVVWFAIVAGGVLNPWMYSGTQYRVRQFIADFSGFLPFIYGIGIIVVALVKRRPGVVVGYFIGLGIAVLLFGLCFYIVMTSFY